MKHTIHILASDFIDNSFLNIKHGLEGCPIEKAVERAGLNQLFDNGIAYCKAHKTVIDSTTVGNKVSNMFENNNPQDFSFEIDIP